MKRVFRQVDIKVLDWPGNSPRLQPIQKPLVNFEISCANLDCTTKTKLVEAIIQLRYGDPQNQEICQTLVESMPKRVKELLKSKGGHTTY